MREDQMENKWKVNRAGLFNYWYYEDQVFDFADGKLLLRGNNGAGKSVTMQSFLPVLLDGSTRPERLDPFGSRARKMEDYLLGEKEVSGHDERTGYLYMEFKRQQTNQYRTIGIGLQAKRGKPLKFWGFVLTDNKRVGIDFPLYKLETHDGDRVKIPLSKIQLRNQMESSGKVVETRSEYAQLVNEYIFGYETIEKYEDLIKLLIQLRSPKLSKEFRPTVIYEILEEALPPLSEEDLRHLSDTIEQMDQTKQQLEQLEREHEAILDLNKVYTAYNEKVLVEQANGLVEAVKRQERVEQEYLSQQANAQFREQEIVRLNKNIEEQKIEKETTEKQQTRLQQHKVWNLEEERQQKKKDLDYLENNKQQTEQRLNRIRKQEYETSEKVDTAELSLQKRQETLTDILEELESDAREASFSATDTIHQDDFKANLTEVFAFDAWRKQVSNHLDHLESIKEDLREWEQSKKAYQVKDKELGEASQEVDALRNEERDWEHWFKEEKQKQLNAIHQWLNEHAYLTVSEEGIHRFSRAMDRLYEDVRYEDVKEPIQEALNEYKAQREREKAQLIVERNGQSQIIEELIVELDEWKREKDPDPKTPIQTKKVRAALEQKGVAFSPFYNVVEFQEGIGEETQKRIEAALHDSGLLDAIISEEEMEITHDRLLKPNPQFMAYTLSEFLKPDIDEKNPTVSAEYVEQILQSILIDESNDQVLSISQEGRYTVGLMEGHAVPVESVRFIGRTARKRYRQQKISELTQLIEQETKKKESIERSIEEKEWLVKQATTDFTTFPNDIDLAEGYTSLEKVRFNIDQKNEQISRLSDEVKQIAKEVRELALSLDQRTRKETLTLSLDDYTVALSHMREYERNVQELRREHELYLHERNQLKNLKERADELEQDFIEAKSEFNRIEGEVTRFRKDIEKIEAQMEKEGVEDIRQQIKDVQAKLRELSTHMDEDKRNLTVHETELNHIHQLIEKSEKIRTFHNYMVETWEQSFEKESKRGLVSIHTIEEEKDSGQYYATQVLNELIDSVSSKEISQLTGQLSRVRNDRQEDLLEYSSQQRTDVLEIPEWMSQYDDLEDVQAFLSEWKQFRSREVIELTVQGKRVSPYVLESDLTQEKERQSVFLDEQDKRLYEEILFQSVGKKLRTRISRAERWVEEMKALMESRNDSSGVEFSIRWKPRTADTDEEMDTKDLVDLLRQDPRLLPDEAIDQVTTHFRTKINQAKLLRDESKEMQTLLQVLKQVLDYRRWFSFELSFKRAGDERKKPLTNTQFDKFSGGEKARAMYIPLFIATYSRYMEASPDAPYIISLDEAFAGIDDHNIADLFEVVEELNFNYIMNSQAIWGTFETVSALTISELYRRQNADHVAVMNYYWDGKKRILLDE
jgi:uncharacterized protein (TIGR02680 family)